MGLGLARAFSGMPLSEALRQAWGAARQGGMRFLKITIENGELRL